MVIWNVLFFRSHTSFVSAGLGYAAASGLAFTVANLSFYKGLEYGPVSIVSPLGSLYPLVTTLLLVVLFSAELSAGQVLGVGIVMLGVSAASGLFERVKSGRRLSRGPLLGLCGALFWGIAWYFIARAVAKIGWQFTAVIELTCSAILFMPLLPLLRQSEPGIIKHLVPSLKSSLMLTAGILMMLGFLSLSIGIDLVTDLATVAVVISACYPVITVFLALHKLGEKFDPIPMLGAFFAIVGVVVLSIG